jgi:error-prone DNA polymerase
MTAYAEFAVTTNFSFLRGASHPEEMVAQALALGLAGIGIADRNSLAGIVRAHVYARENGAAAKGLKLAIGARLIFADGTPDLLAYPQDRAAYARLSRLLTRGNLRAEKGACTLFFEDLADHAQGLQLALLPISSGPMTADGATIDARIAALKELAPHRLWIAARMTYGRSMRRDLIARHALASKHRLPLLATNDVHMHTSTRRPLADILTCTRAGVTIDSAGTQLAVNAERHLKSPREMARIFREAPQAIEETQRFLNGLSFSLDELAYEYPDEVREGFSSEQEALEYFSWEGARFRYPDGVPEKVAATIRHELKLVAQMKYAAYFLTVHDIVRFARGRGILCQGRGSAANSTICFCLGITEVDPTKHDLLFERFISPERKEPPDIDVDFEHERREEVMQYIYARYGRLRAGLTATVISYRAKSAIRDVGKAFGYSEDALNSLSGAVFGWRSGTFDEAEIRRIGFDPNEPRLKQTLALAQELTGFPRHLSQHTGGFVITRARLDEVVPVANAAMEDRTTIEWDKDDLDALGILKIDVLALGMLSCLRKGFDLLRSHYARDLTLATIPAEEPCVYEMISRADTIGVFQIESRAQMSMLPRLKPRAFYDLVIEVAIVRPGPIQGDMVHPYLRRRQGLEKVTYPSKELESVLGKTLGVPLFQEQAMKIAIVAAGFTPSEADQLRRAMATFKKVGTIGTFHKKMVEGMAARGYDREFAEACFRQIEGFGTYGFPESHAASFALLVYASAWMKCRYPDVFACALLNSQPMGFYAPAQIIRDARDHGVEIREADINHSDWDNILEPVENAALQLHGRHESQRVFIQSHHAIRIGLRQVKGMREEDMRKLVALRGKGYDSMRDVWLRTGLSPAVLEHLAEANAFGSIGLDRRDAIWAVRGLNRAGDKDDLPLFRMDDARELEPDAHLPPMPPGEEVVEDYRHLALSLKAHPVSFLRAQLDRRRILRTADLDHVATPATTTRLPAWKLPRVTVAGLVLVRQRPGSAKGVLFMTIEDETGVANAIVWPKLFEAQRAIVIGARFVAITGRVQNEAGVIHIVAEQVEDLTSMLWLLSAQGGDVSGLARADEVRRPQTREKASAPKPAAGLSDEAPALPPALDPVREEARRVLPRGRNFH